MKKKLYVLVYQGGIANVFLGKVKGKRKRIMQHAFGPCEWYCRGLKEAGAKVEVAWCNMAGDIDLQDWSYKDFDLAPFHDKFALNPEKTS